MATALSQFLFPQMAEAAGDENLRRFLLQARTICAAGPGTTCGQALQSLITQGTQWKLVPAWLLRNMEFDGDRKGNVTSSIIFLCNTFGPERDTNVSAEYPLDR